MNEQQTSVDGNIINIDFGASIERITIYICITAVIITCLVVNN